MQPVTLEAVQAAMPDDGGAARVRGLSPVRSAGRAERRSVRAAALRGIRRAQARGARGRDLGAATTIDGMIDALRQALRNPARTRP